MNCLRTALLLIFLICVVPCQSNAYFLGDFRKLAEGDLSSKKINQMSPSPSPAAPEANMISRSVESPENPPKAETCEMVFHKCDIKDYNITACVPFVGNGTQASYVLIMNDGDSSHQLKITVLPTNNSEEDVAISGHQVKKVNLPPNTRGNSSILLTVANGDCIIHIGASVPQSFYTSYVTPINGKYLLFATAMFMGGIWACCKLGNRRRHLNGVPYQGLEMGQKESEPPFSIETPEGWDENWDDDWDEEKSMRSPGANHEGRILDNGASLKYIDTSQWRNDWDD